MPEIGIGISPMFGKGVGGTNPSTSLYMNAVGILNDDTVYFDGAQERTGAELWDYVNTVVTGLKLNNLWDGYSAIYPLLGTTASQHKFNLKSPYNLDTSFRFDFDDGGASCTHDKFGLGVGVNKYANTKFIPLADGMEQISGCSAYWYSRTSTSDPGYVWGGYGFTTFYSDATNTWIGNGASIAPLTASTPFQGRHLLNRAPNGTTERYLKNGSLVEAPTKTFVRFSEAEVWIGAIKDTSSPFNTFYSSAINIGFFAIGYGLTTEQETIADGIFNTYLTNLDR